MLIATGCLTQRYGEELLKLMPEIDILMGVNDYMKLHKLILDFIKGERNILSANYSDEIINEGERLLTTDKHTAYVRIAEGCDNYCTYCIIPKIRGKFRSRSIESIIKEVKHLAENGVKEIILIAQDLTNYGIDIYDGKRLHILVNEISKVEGIEWVRLLYCYPEEITEDLIEEMASNEKVVKYLDIPIQHISSKILKLMGRKTNKENVIGIINKLRNRIPNIVLRTSLIVGFPNETEEDFTELEEFLKEYKLDNVGVFKYSKEEGTPAAEMDNHLSEEIKVERYNKLMEIQKEIVENLNKLKISKIYDTIIEGRKGKYFIGRSTEMAPEIDGNIFIETDENLKKGDIVKVKINKTLDYDLIGEVYNEFSK